VPGLVSHLRRVGCAARGVFGLEGPVAYRGAQPLAVEIGQYGGVFAVPGIRTF
jgi:hypothetical protein